MLSFAMLEDRYRHQYNRDPYLGMKLGNGAYVKYDPVGDCFIAYRVGRVYEFLPDPLPNDPKKQRHVRLPKALWELHAYAEIHRSKLVVLEPVKQKFLDYFGVECMSSRTIKLSGNTWKFKDQTGNGHAPVIIENGIMIITGAPKVRVFDAERRKEMNDLIKEIRNLMRVRHKLGAFNTLTQNEVNEYVISKLNMTKWDVFDTPTEFIKLMKAVNGEDFKSFYPLLWLADRYSWHTKNNYSQVDWTAKFNALIDHMREKMRKELGVVSYVEATERSADQSDGSMEAERGDELREM